MAGALGDPPTGETLLGKLPPEIGGVHFGPELRTFIKSRINFLGLLRAGHDVYTVNDAALAYMAEQSLAKGPLESLRQLHKQRPLDGQAPHILVGREAWQAKLKDFAIIDERPVRVATEGALLGTVVEQSPAYGERERDIREYVKKRKISGSTRSADGRRCRDTFTSLKKTCRKQGLTFWAYLKVPPTGKGKDRVFGTGRIPPLADWVFDAGGALRFAAATDPPVDGR